MILSPKVKYDDLCQRFGENPVCRSFNFGRAHSKISWNEFDRSLIDAHERITGSKFDEARTLEFTFSTEGIKRDGNRIRQEGWVLDTYRKNPQALWCHDQLGEPIGNSPAQWLSRTNGLKSLRGLIQFVPEDIDARAARIEKYYRSGFLNAVSISWNPLEVQLIPEEEMAEAKYQGGWSGGLDFLRSEALEITACPVPADPDALQKRIQSGEIDAGEMVLRTPEEIEIEGKKRGVFYVDGHQFERDQKTMVDMGAKNGREGQSDTNIPEPETRSEFTFNQDIKNTIDSILAENVDLRTVVYKGSGGQEAARDFCVHYLQVVEPEVRECKGFGWQVEFEPYDGRSVALLPINGTDFYFQVEFREAKPVEGVLERVVKYDSHGKVEINRDATWDSVAARDRIAKWATPGEEGIDFRQFRKGFTWFDEHRSDSVSGYKLPHHDIVGDRFVTVMSGLKTAAQRVMQRSVDIPEGDWAAVERHLEAEFETAEEVAPWKRTLGQMYINIHNLLRSDTIKEDEIVPLRHSAVSLAKELFGDDRVIEKWEKRATPYAVNDEKWTEVVDLVEQRVNSLTTDTEAADDTVNSILGSVIRTLDISEADQNMRLAISMVARRLGIDSVDYSSKEETAEICARLAGDLDVSNAINSLKRKVEQTFGKPEKQETKSVETILTRILNKVKVEDGSSDSQDDEE